jgi:hypothetical protein
LIETLRHLVFATDAWIRRAILGDPIAISPAGPAVGPVDGPGWPEPRSYPVNAP